MPTDADPIVNNWYEHLDKGQVFRVVAFDEDTDTVEIQYFDGDLEEVDIEAWYLLDIEPTDDPEDWSGPLDQYESEDGEYVDDEDEGNDWRAATRETRPRRRIMARSGVEDEMAELDEDWGDEELLGDDAWEGDEEED